MVVLSELAKEDAIEAFVNGLKPYLIGFVKAQLSNLTDPMLNEAMMLALKLEENAAYTIPTSSQCPFRKLTPRAAC